MRHQPVHRRVPRGEEREPKHAPFLGERDVVREPRKIVDKDVILALLGAGTPISPDSVRGRLTHQYVRLIGANGDAIGEVEIAQRQADQAGAWIIREQSSIRTVLEKVRAQFLQRELAGSVAEVNGAVLGYVDV